MRAAIIITFAGLIVALYWCADNPVSFFLGYIACNCFDVVLSAWRERGNS